MKETRKTYVAIYVLDMESSYEETIKQGSCLSEDTP